MVDEHRGTAAATPATGVGVAAALTALLLAAPRPPTALAVLAGGGTSGDPTAPLVAAVALAAWVLAGWLALTVALVLASRLPGLLGRGGRAVAGRVAPAAVRRSVEVALGLTVAVGAVAPSTALAAAPAPSAAADGWDLDWPSLTTVPSGAERPSPAPTTVRPTTVRPTTVRPAAPAAATSPPATPPVSRPAALPPAVRPSVATPVRSLVVRSGDSLWSISERSLHAAGTPPTDAEVAREWPRWWAANRDAVGDDPDLLLPGTVLRPPPGSAAPR